MKDGDKTIASKTDELASYPDRYWHCSVTLVGKSKASVVNDLSFEELQKQIVLPWHQDGVFPVSGLVVNGRAAVHSIRIAQTDKPKEDFANQWNAECRANKVADMATDRRLVPIWRGKDYTHDLLFSGLQKQLPDPEIELVVRLCKRLPAAARILANRRSGKTPFSMSDEYDVQDLMHSILRAYVKHSVTEEPMGKIAGVRHGRADIAIEDLQTIIEAKFVRGPDDQRRLVEEYSNDLLLYTKWPSLKHLIFLIYNSQDLRDPEAFEKLEGPQNVNGVEFNVYMALA